ncbi:MAG: menaquinone biosynthesis protein [Phycisphaeraceae bacterium]|nr:menaquinone biosynthesis protein [Phycisphaeraceae bacterium]
MASLSTTPFRLGVVRYLNTLPLIHGLDRLHGLELVHDVPARLIERLAADEVEMALCSTIDLSAASPSFEVVPVGCLACHGETLTVRLFARRPLHEVRTLHADAESHTSVALARILLRELHGISPEIVPWRDGDGAPEWSTVGDALLLIGDKAVLRAPPESHFPVRMDLGEAWAALTGLPFVFAIWMTRDQRSAEQAQRRQTVAAILDHQRRHNRTRIDWIASRHAAARGWDEALARRYLGELLDFEFTARHQQGLERFLSLAAQHGVIPSTPKVRVAAERAEARAFTSGLLDKANGTTSAHPAGVH